MASRLKIGFLIVTFLVGGYSLVAETPRTEPHTGTNKVINRPGEFVSPNKKCRAVLTVSSLGGFLVLALRRKASRRIKANDVTGMAWVSGQTLVYTTSSIYGVPGVYVYNCDSNKTTRIVAPRTFDKAYPDGADYFELQGTSDGNPATIYFYYAPDVDKADFKNFRAPSSLFEVRLDGTDFRKAE